MLPLQWVANRNHGRQIMPEIPELPKASKPYIPSESEIGAYDDESSERWAYVPSDAKIIGEGGESRVFRQPNSRDVYRVEDTPKPGSFRPQIEPVLQPIASK